MTQNLTLFLCLSDVDVRTPRRIHLGDASVRKARITKVRVGDVVLAFLPPCRDTMCWGCPQLMRHQRLQFCFEVEAPRRAFVVRDVCGDGCAAGGGGGS